MEDVEFLNVGYGPAGGIAARDARRGTKRVCARAAKFALRALAV